MAHSNDSDSNDITSIFSNCQEILSDLASLDNQVVVVKIVLKLNESYGNFIKVKMDESKFDLNTVEKIKEDMKMICTTFKPKSKRTAENLKRFKKIFESVSNNLDCLISSNEMKPKNNITKFIKVLENDAFKAAKDGNIGTSVFII